MNLSDLPNSIRDHLNKTDATVGFSVIDIERDIYWEYDNHRFLAASTIKLPVMAAFFQACELGLIHESQTYKFSREELIEDSPILDKLSSNKNISYLDLVKAMIVLSDNTATNIIINLLGIHFIQKWMKDNHFHQTELNRLMMDFKSRQKGIDNWTTPAEMSFFMHKLYLKQLVSTKKSQEMISILESTQDLEKIPYLFDDSVKIANKPGELPSNRSDVALLSDNSRNMVMSVFCENVLNDEKTDLWIAEFAVLFWNLKIS